MAKNQIMFFATGDDLGSVLSNMEATAPLRYTVTGLFENEKPQTYDSYSELPGLGEAIHPDAIANPLYLLSFHHLQIQSRHVQQIKGGVRFAIDQRENPDTIVVAPGGRYGSVIILSGMLGTISQTAISQNLYTNAANIVRKSFFRHQEYFIGPAARELWNLGVRLTDSASSPIGFDLKRKSQ
jgi:hypothetical protein